MNPYQQTLYKNHSYEERFYPNSLHIMYPLKQLCKQYTNPSLSEILLEGISPLPPLPRSPVLWLDSKQGSRGNPMGGAQSANHHLALVTHVRVFLQGPDSAAGAARGSLGGASASLQCLLSPSWRLSFCLPFHPEATCMASTPHPTPVPSFPRDPLPTPHTKPSHDRNK